MSLINRAAAVVTVALGAAAVAGYPVYVTPQVDEPRTADAIVVLGGSADDREQVGLDLAESGYAPRLIYSDPYGAASTLTEICADRSRPFSIECFVPDPNTTRGEAREIRDLAEGEGWSTVIVVTSKPHISRARYIFDKCWSGSGIFVSSTTDMSLPGWAWSYAYQTAGYVRASFEHC